MPMYGKPANPKVYCREMAERTVIDMINARGIHIVMASHQQLQLGTSRANGELTG